jgi:hypothetical protein
MSAGTYDITIDQKADFIINLAFKDPVTNLPIPLTGYSFKSEIKASYGGALITTFTVTVTSEPLGTVSMALTEVQTALLLGKNYVYDLIGTVGAPAITTRFMQGKITYSPGVTDP